MCSRPRTCNQRRQRPADSQGPWHRRDRVQTRTSEDYQSLVTVTVSDGEESVSVCGTQFGGEEPRIVRIDDHRIEAVPDGHMLVVRNRDEPGTPDSSGPCWARLTSTRREFNGRETIGGDAQSVYNLDEQPPQDIIERLNDDSRIIETTSSNSATSNTANFLTASSGLLPVEKAMYRSTTACRCSRSCSSADSSVATCERNNALTDRRRGVCRGTVTGTAEGHPRERRR